MYIICNQEPVITGSIDGVGTFTWPTGVSGVKLIGVNDNQDTFGGNNDARYQTTSGWIINVAVLGANQVSWHVGNRTGVSPTIQKAIAEGLSMIEEYVEELASVYPSFDDFDIAIHDDGSATYEYTGDGGEATVTVTLVADTIETRIHVYDSDVDPGDRQVKTVYDKTGVTATNDLIRGIPRAVMRAVATVRKLLG